MKQLLIAIFIIFGVVSHAQEILLDSLFEEAETIPCVDVIDYDSKIYQESLKMGLNFFEYGFSECDQSSDQLEEVNRISSIEKKSDSLVFNLQIIRNCCAGSLSSIEIIDSLTWNFVMQSQEDGGCDECFCFCCFSVNYKVVNLSNSTPEKFMLNGELIRVSDTAIERYSKVIEHWENGEIKTVTRYNLDRIEYRTNFDQDGKKVSIEFFDKSGELIKKRYKK